jgi:acetate kinase
MNIFVVNSGSSSIKYQLFRMPTEQPLCSGLVERIGLEEGKITHKVYLDGEEKAITKTAAIPDHEAGLLMVKDLLCEPGIGVIQNPQEIDAVGHRVVHGGERFATTTVINSEVKEKIKELFALAPLHNPANFTGIEVAEHVFTNALQVAVFDTAFHQTMPEKAFRYAIPNELYTEKGIRAYGFHGTSHKYVTQKAIEYLGNEDAKIVTIHLGNGSSMAAVDKGQSVDTSMGLGPMGGLVMGTRSGDIDPSIIFHLVKEGYTVDEVNTLLNKKSGMLGLTGYSDMRDVLTAIANGDRMAKLAYDMYAYRIKKYIGSYAAILNGLDAIVFTAGIGENDSVIREKSCEQMDFLGIELDIEKNSIRSKGIREINKEGAPVKILVIPTNEELEIVRQCFELLTEVSI